MAALDTISTFGWFGATDPLLSISTFGWFDGDGILAVVDPDLLCILLRINRMVEFELKL